MLQTQAEARREIFGKKSLDYIINSSDVNIAINSREVRANFSKVVKAAESEKYKIIVTDHGEPKAAITSLDDLCILNWLEKLKIRDMVKSLAQKDLSHYEFLMSLHGHDPEEHP